VQLLRERGPVQCVTEYMATGTACVVSDGGGNKDLVRHGETGLVFPVGDAAALAACILTLVRDEAQREAFANAGRAMVHAEMSLPVIIDRYESFYRRLRLGNT
jgi:glycosyltransferase involved in cell wall biosynthesis